ncbi:hemerythrin family protein [Azospirillum halopraeferens]|uniref:hemerythrin family protein n=1 Tax=Azospirillum halopraeferens TaxID=34010 RepID=UPI000429EE18|nr:hemerythrin family protein [Azospirillum halopraeferens]
MGSLDHHGLHAGYGVILDHLGQVYQDSLDHPSDAALADGLQRLSEALDCHFDRENRLMADRGYPDATRHAADHALIRRVLHKLTDSALRCDGDLARREVPFLIHLVYEHRRRDDLRLAEFLDGAGERVS